MQFFARFESNCAAWRDWNFRAGARIPSNSGFSRSDAEDAEATQLDTITCGKSILHAFEDSIDCRLRLDARKTRPVCNLVYHVLFDQGNLSAKRNFWYCVVHLHARDSF